MSFSEMTDILGVSNSFLTYHLENLGELIGKMEDGKYRLSSFGEAAMSTMGKVEDIPTSFIQSPQTKPKRVIGRSAAIALGIIYILLIASLGGAIVYYMIAIDNRENEINSQKARINQLESNLTNLQNQVSNFITPRLIPINLTAHDLSGGSLITSEPIPMGSGSPPTFVNSSNISSSIVYISWLNVNGFLLNIGNNTAYNCLIHVVAFSNDSSLAIDTNIELGAIPSYSWVHVDESLPYNSLRPEMLINWTITPQWTANP
jgi:hypothetical protein